MDIVCLGELLVDMFPAELGRSLVEVSAFRPKPGGAPANVAVAAARLGAKSAFIGKVGDDAFGHHLADILRQEDVEVGGMRYDPEARTGMAFIAMPDENSYDILFYRNPGADMRLRADELDRAVLEQARAFHFGSLSLIQEPSRGATLEAARIARNVGALISFDVNYRPDLWSREEACERVLATIPVVDLLKVNEVELEILTGSADPDTASQALLALGPDLCVVTLGPEGSFFRVAGGGEFVPPFRVKTVDATGCGDAFVAGLLWQLIRRGGWREQLTVARMREVLRYANAVGALTSLTLGVIPALPTAEQVEEFLGQADG
jgi:fructokinase